MYNATPLGFLLLALDVHVRRARSSQEDRGASVVEWVIIAAIVVGLAILIAGILRGALQGEAEDISDKIQNQ